MRDKVNINTVDISQLEVFFQPAKKPAKQTIVFAHGFSVHHSYFKSFSETLVDYDYYAPLWPGHNHHGFTDKELSPIHYAHLLVAWIEKQDLENIVLIGHSMGGAVASYALQFLKPQRVEKLVLLAPLSYSNLLNYYKIKKAFKKKDEKLSYFKRMFQPKFPDLQNDGQWQMELDKHTAMCKKLTFQIFKELSRLNSAYKTITIPAFLLLAQHDDFMPTKATLNYFNRFLIKKGNLQSGVILHSQHQMFNSKHESFCKAMQDILKHNKLGKIY